MAIDRRIRTVGLVWGLMVAASVARAEQAGPVALGRCEALPANIQATPALGALLVRLIDQSPTLKRQCLALADLPHVRVRLQFPARPLGHWCRARARIERFAGGAIHALIEMPVTADYAELLAHEFEHVFEMIEGINFATRAAEPGSGVSRTLEGTFETDRAQRTGRQAGAEVYDASRQSRLSRHVKAGEP